jgi:hypothetical protein
MAVASRVPTNTWVRVGAELERRMMSARVRCVRACVCGGRIARSGNA